MWRDVLGPVSEDKIFFYATALLSTDVYICVQHVLRDDGIFFLVTFISNGMPYWVLGYLAALAMDMHMCVRACVRPCVCLLLSLARQTKENVLVPLKWFAVMAVRDYDTLGCSQVFKCFAKCLWALWRVWKGTPMFGSFKLGITSPVLQQLFEYICTVKPVCIPLMSFWPL